MLSSSNIVSARNYFAQCFFFFFWVTTKACQKLDDVWHKLNILTLKLSLSELSVKQCVLSNIWFHFCRKTNKWSVLARLGYHLRPWPCCWIVVLLLNSLYLETTYWSCGCDSKNHWEKIWDCRCLIWFLVPSLIWITVTELSHQIFTPLMVWTCSSSPAISVVLLWSQFTLYIKQAIFNI